MLHPQKKKKENHSYKMGYNYKGSRLDNTASHFI